jgi:hypothetical protein
MGLFSGLVSSIAGPAIGGLLGLAGQSSANKANAQLASEANATSIDLANTAHQREVKDLIAAGLNPMLSYHTSGSATPQLHVAKMENTADSASRSASAASNVGLNAMQQALMRSQIDTQESQADLNSASAAKVRAETLNVPLAGQYTQALTSKVNPEIQQILSSSSLNSVNYNKVLKEIDLLDSQNKLTKANVLEVLSKTNLHKAEISRIAAEMPLITSKSFFGGSAETGARAAGEALGNSAGAAHMYVEDFRNNMIKRRSAYEHRSR